jgi:hypothetical protein
MFLIVYPPAKTFGLPEATAVHPAKASPTRPIPKPFTNTVVEPTAMTALCDGMARRV